LVEVALADPISVPSSSTYFVLFQFPGRASSGLQLHRAQLISANGALICYTSHY
jgi:hypothetical protein